MSRQHLLAAAGVAAAVLVASLACVLLLRSHWNAPYRGFTDEVSVVVEKGAGAWQIGRELEAAGVIPSARLFRWYLRTRGPSYFLQAGEYRFDRAISPAEVAAKLHNGDIYLYKVTIPEGLTLREIASRLSAQGLADRETFEDLAGRADLISDLDPAAEDLEGYLFPETYYFQRAAGEKDIIRSMTDRFRSFWTDRRQRLAKNLEMNVREIVTLASLIEKETALDAERPLVAAVFHNRLRLNMKLECDPTVIYAVSLVKEFDGIIHRSDLEIDSPYNTYRYAGLPPGPIANPGNASIEAALDPAPVDYLFFVARNDGSHVFSTSYGDHRRAVMTHQRGR